MKKFLLFFLFCCFVPPTAHANDAAFNTNKAFSLAKAVKLGRGSSYFGGGINAINTGATINNDKKCEIGCQTCDTKTGKCSKCQSGYGMKNGYCTRGTNYYNADKSACYIVTDDYVGWCGGGDHSEAYLCVEDGNVAGMEGFVRDDPTGSVIKVSLSDCQKSGAKIVTCAAGYGMKNGYCTRGTNYYNADKSACYIVTDDYVGWCGGSDHSDAYLCVEEGSVNSMEDFVNEDPTGSVIQVSSSDCRIMNARAVKPPACPTNCSTCSNGTCTKCKSGYYLSNGSCHKEKSCGSNCSVCDKTTGKCTACASGYFPSNGISGNYDKAKQLSG